MYNTMHIKGKGVKEEKFITPQYVHCTVQIAIHRYFNVMCVCGIYVKECQCSS